MAGRRFLVCYDICDARRLRGVARIMQSYGRRIQYSVFECRLTELQVIQLKSAIESVIENAEDQVLFVSLIDRNATNDNLVITAVGRAYTAQSLVTII